MARVDIPGIGMQTFPDSMSDKEILAQAREMQTRVSQPKQPLFDPKDQSISQIIKGGFSRGLEGLKGTAFDLIPALGASLIGKDDYAKEQLKEYQDRIAAAEEANPTAYKSYKEANTPGNALGYAAETFGELGPDIAAFVASAMTGSFGAGAFARKGGAKVVEKLAEEYALKKGIPLTVAKEALASEIAKQETTNLVKTQAAKELGTKLGIGTASGAINIPDTFNKIYEDTRELHPGIALTIGSLVAALDTYLPTRMLDQLGVTGKTVLATQMLEKSKVVPITWKKAFIGETLKTTSMEGLTEGTQQALQILGSQLAGDKQKFFSQKNIDDIIESSVKGMVGGASFGMPGAALDARRIKANRNAQIQEQEQQKQKQIQEQEQAANVKADQKMAAQQQATGNLFGEEQGPATQYDARQAQEDMAEQTAPAALRLPAQQQMGLDLQGGMTAEDIAAQQRETQRIAQNQAMLAQVQMQQQETIRRAAEAKAAFNQAIVDTDARVQSGELNRRQAARLELLHPVLENTGIKDTVAAFQGNLKRAGYANLELTDYEKDLIQKADNVKAALAESEVVQPIEQEPTLPNQLTPEITGIKEKGEKGPAGTPQPKQLNLFGKQRFAPAVEEVAPEPTINTVLDADTLSSTGLPKQSPFFKQLMGKDMANPADQTAIGEILAKIRANRLISESTKDAVERIANQGFVALAQQQEMFNPKGGIKRGAQNGRVQPRPLNTGVGTSVSIPNEELPAGTPEGIAASEQQGVGPNTPPATEPAVRETLQPNTLTETAPVETAPTPPAATEEDVSTKAAKKYIAKLETEHNKTTDPQRQAALRDQIDELEKRYGLGRFRTGQGEGMAKADVESHAANVVKGWKNAPPVKVVKDQTELPKHLQEQIEKEGITNPKGVWDPRTQSVYLVANNLDSKADATFVILHEITGHFGLQKILGDKFNSVMNQIYNGNKDVKDRADIKISNGMEKTVAIEEVLAEMAETATNPTLIQKVINMIRNALRFIGAQFNSVTDGEIRQILQDSYKFVTGSETAGFTDSDITRASFSGITDALRKWFGNSKAANPDGSPITLYHGTTADFKQFKLSPSGALGAGIYLTPNTEFANYYASSKNARVIPAIAKITNPLIIKTVKGQSGQSDPMVDALIQLGIPSYKAEKIVEKAYEEKGYITREVMSRAQAAGYDGIFQYVNGELSEVLAYNPGQVKSIFNKTPQVGGAKFSTGAGATFRTNPSAPGVTSNDARSVFDSFTDRIEKTEFFGPAVANRVDEFFRHGVVGNARKAAMWFLPLGALVQEAKRAGLYMAPELNKTVEEQSKFVKELNEIIEPLVKRAEDWAKKVGKQAINAFNDVVYDSTISKIDPTKPKKDETTPEDYKRVVDKFNKLDPMGKTLYKNIRDANQEMYQNILDSIEERINTFVTDPNTRALLKEDILEKLSKRGRIDPYFALTRTGNYWLSYNLNNEPYVEAYTTERERNKQAAIVEKEGAEPNSIQKFTQLSEYKYSRAPSGSFVNKMLHILESNKPQGLSQEASKNYDEASDQVMRLYLSTLPETSFAQSFQKRKETLGFEKDAIGAMRDKLYSTAQQLGRMKYSAKLSKILEDMRIYAKLVSKGYTGDKDEQGNYIVAKDAQGNQINVDNGLMNDYISVFEKTVNAMSSPQSGASKLINTIGFNYLLGFNLSSALVNLGQVPMIVTPYLAGEHSWGDTTAAIGKAYRNYLQSGYGEGARSTRMIGSDEMVKQKAMLSVANYGEDTAMGKHYQTLIEKGDFGRSQFYDVLEVDGRKSWTNTLNAASGYAFHHGERMNREVTMMAAYDLQLAKLKKQGKTGKEAEIEAANYAIDVTEMTNGGVSAASSPLIAKNDIGKVLFMFKRYGVSMYYMLFKVTRDALQNQDKAVKKAAMSQIAGIYGTSALFAGLQGIPMFGVAAMIYNLFKDDDDDDMETATRKYVGEFAYKGMLNHLTGSEIASRTSLSDLVFRSNPSGASNTFQENFLQMFGGPAYGVTSRIKRGLDFMNEGNMERGIENVLPSAFGNMLKALRFGTEGARTLRGDPITEDINAFSIGAQALGFAPAEYTRQLEINSQLKGIEKDILQNKTKLLQKWNIAKAQGDYEDANEYKDKLKELNDKHPGLKINANTFEASDRAFKAASKRMVNGVQFNQKLYNEMMQRAAEYDDK
jgi:ADP-Ribosyltransferase in polyvalent proteins